MTTCAFEQSGERSPEFQVKVYGDSPAELEQGAREAAVAFFGPDAPLEVSRRYCARPRISDDDTGKAFAAFIYVREAAPELP